MSVVNSEYAKSVGMNGRVKGKLVLVTLQPGLNHVDNLGMTMLRKNESFESHCALKKMSVVEHEDSDVPEEPADIKAIDITSMSVEKAGIVIGSAVKIELLDQFKQQESDGENRKGIIGAIEKQRKEVERIIKVQNSANREDEKN